MYKMWINLKEFIWVVKHWRLYYDTIQSMHNEWFNIDVENAPVQYLCDPDMSYCRFCSAKYVQFTEDEWGIEPQDIQRHLPGCPWKSIEILRSCWYHA